MWIEIIPCLQTNYAYLICDGVSKTCAGIDPADADAVGATVKAKGLKLTHILNTHHHSDHTGGNLALKATFGAKVVGAANDRPRIPGLDIGLEDGAVLPLASGEVCMIATPGHTRGSVSYALGDALFTGDTLFAMGCGRLFEGNAATMMASLARIAARPDATLIYPGHEYTETDGRFAAQIEPDNADVRARLATIKAGRAPVPFTLAEEKRTNPFLRPESASIRETLGMDAARPQAVFAEIRRRKDVF
jgi:hydroxyacylglutathione hydrolase